MCCTDYDTAFPADVPSVVGWGWTANDSTALSWAIRWFTRPGWGARPLARWSHMFLVFGFPGQTAPGVIHEALGSDGWCDKPASKLDAWQAESPKHHAWIEWLDIPPHGVAAIWADSRSWFGTRSYAFQQLAVFFLAHSLAGRALRAGLPTLFNLDLADDRVVCSEGACRLVGEHWPELDLRKFREPWAAISPQAAWERYMLFRRTSKI